MPCTRGRELDFAEFALDPRADAWDEFRGHALRCPDCSRELARFGVLKAALADEGAGTSAHPSEAQLLALATGAGAIAADERTRLDAHLAGCAPCRTELAAIRGFDPTATPSGRVAMGWFDRVAGALRLAVPRPLLAAAVIALLAIPAALLVWQHAQQTRATTAPPTAALRTQTPPEGPAQRVPEPTAVAEARPAEPPVAPAPPAPAEPMAIAERRPAVERPPDAERPPAPRPPPAPEAPAAKPTAPPPPFQIAALVPSEAPLYSPGALASGPSLRIEGLARGLGPGIPTPEALGPAHVAASGREAPNLYWLLPEASSSSAVEVTLVDPDADAPLLETTVAAPVAAGVHRVSLAEHGVRLRPGVDYRWFVALVRDPGRRSQDVVSGAAIRFTPPGPDERARLSSSPPERAAHLYAESGLWYDAFDQLSTWLADEPGAAVLRRHRAALLEQVGLDDAAVFELRSASHSR